MATSKRRSRFGPGSGNGNPVRWAARLERATAVGLLVLTTTPAAGCGTTFTFTVSAAGEPVAAGADPRRRSAPVPDRNEPAGAVVADDEPAMPRFVPKALSQAGDRCAGYRMVNSMER